MFFIFVGMFFEIANLILSILMFLALVVYAYLTYLIAKDIYNPLVSFSLEQRGLTHLDFDMINKSKVEVEVFGKLWSNIGDETFEFKDGFYGDKKHWILQPFTRGHGHFYLKDLLNKEGIKLDTFVKKKSINSITFNMQIKYRKVGRRKWKKTSPQNFVYNFDKNLFWLNV